MYFSTFASVVYILAVKVLHIYGIVHMQRRTHKQAPMYKSAQNGWDIAWHRGRMC